ncbi:hypothetical protein SAMN02745248_02682 [Hathewaya proteolytica DSM 3090]|uniref:Uncharacterized protein n=1 Tax=Hathewaya proteolytica DSM 3090 TaxID=1121331 RepID=A0A1M6SZN2_9CLOT|nr:hypothetical protein [Hathewaya proteolytica]SHK50126.1 hypothetical protein SAMN02745248_02682 [Hathewaya proteolytica DSM 3090]
MNLSVDAKEFKDQVKELRKKLNESKSNGILHEEFQAQLADLLKREEELLCELIPYYRLYSKDEKINSMEIKSLKKLGAFEFNSFLKSSLRISDNLFMVTSIDRKVQLLYIKHTDQCGDDEEIEVEWSPCIKGIDQVISFIYKINHKEILLFGERGGCYLISSENFNEMPDVNTELEIKSIDVNCPINDFGRCLEINENLFVAENGDEKLILCEIVKNKSQYSIICHHEINCVIPKWTTFEKIDENYFALETKMGEIYFIKYENKRLNIVDKFDFLESEIREIKGLEEENGGITSLAVVGNKGYMKILHLSKDKELEKREQAIHNLKGNLFQVQSEMGTAVILSEDGIAYLFEENFGEWHLNEEATMDEAFLTNVLKLQGSKYLIMDVEDNFNMLQIHRVGTAKDLWHATLYK